ncbi:MAG: hypothetical protein K2W82_17620 [Candidatus Obscuribacterales bacterium]|jgi:hypothetical protein|nr:hypothetical protein [Candidatus Obscuribacterales bacterium]
MKARRKTSYYVFERELQALQALLVGKEPIVSVTHQLPPGAVREPDVHIAYVYGRNADAAQLIPVKFQDMVEFIVLDPEVLNALAAVFAGTPDHNSRHKPDIKELDAHLRVLLRCLHIPSAENALKGVAYSLTRTHVVDDSRGSPMDVKAAKSFAVIIADVAESFINEHGEVDKKQVETIVEFAASAVYSENLDEVIFPRLRQRLAAAVPSFYNFETKLWLEELSYTSQSRGYDNDSAFARAVLETENAVVAAFAGETCLLSAEDREAYVRAGFAALQSLHHIRELKRDSADY